MKNIFAFLLGTMLLKGGRFNIAKYVLNTLFFGYMCCVFALTLFIEVGQLTGLFFLYAGSYRLCDVDDLILYLLYTFYSTARISSTISSGDFPTV